MADPRFAHTRRFAKKFKEDTDGSMTVLGLFLFVVSGILGALALDVTAMYANRTHLQVAADQAAHAALYNLRIGGKDHDEAKTAAIDVVQATLPIAGNGITVDADDIEFGIYDPATETFTADPTSRVAVRVITSFSDERSNAATTFLFRLIGRDSFQIFAQSTFATYTPDCFSDGFLAEGIVDMQNQNFFGAGLCVHSNIEVQLQVNNEFENGAIVSMPGGANTVVVPGDKIDDVSGLSDALADDEFDLRVLSRIENMLYQYQNPTGTDFPHPGVSGDEIGWPSYITDKIMRDLGTVSEIDSTTLTAGGVYYVNCSQPNKGLTISSGNGSSAQASVSDDTSATRQGKRAGSEDTRMQKNENNNGRNNRDDDTTDGDTGRGSEDALPVLSEVIVITPCDVKFGEGSVIENARVISLSQGDKSFQAPHGLSLGSLDSEGCEQNGAQLVTMGGVSFAADFAAFGSQIFTMGDIKFAATPGKPNDFKGTSMVSNGVIDMASHVNAQAGCNSASDDNDIQATFLKMVR
ncbi:pilus assembly protein TadG-related protein [Yoonia litorea]|uniref:Putative Flp pilus-assembly TadE/G-like n=1 Tax=Yoonia litorea TaxID=1123755 RepID=A0A1I6N173_9RHOB|nr:pilus assembly protein TadG-related protein [Yoonia litorea]SFS21715.1 Putative Flp pilus-assembly TadE/G-like [Yoonia litorea]